MAQCIPWQAEPERVLYGLRGEHGCGFITVGDGGSGCVTIHVRPSESLNDEGSPILLSRDKAIRIAAEILKAIA